LNNLQHFTGEIIKVRYECTSFKIFTNILLVDKK